MAKEWKDGQLAKSIRRMLQFTRRNGGHRRQRRQVKEVLREMLVQPRLRHGH